MQARQQRFETGKRGLERSSPRGIKKSPVSQEDVPLERAELLKKALLGGLAVTGGFLAAGRVDLAGASSPTAGTDLRILNFMLYLEYMMSALYREALKKDALRGELLD
ncbi:MAG TPA: hypothetical protein VE975_02975, partial [Actinomycetota bacterium]|nr:hypothetical protein [Actinomycetota bacterium]